MRTTATTAARDTARDTVLPAVRDALHTAREKGAVLLDSDAAHEARRRGLNVVKAAKGDPVVESFPGRWRFGLGMVLAGTGIGLGLAWVARRFLTQPEPYVHTMPAPSGTVTSEPTRTDTTADVDLRAGMRTTM